MSETATTAAARALDSMVGPPGVGLPTLVQVRPAGVTERAEHRRPLGGDARGPLRRRFGGGEAGADPDCDLVRRDACLPPRAHGAGGGRAAFLELRRLLGLDPELL